MRADKTTVTSAFQQYTDVPRLLKLSTSDGTEHSIRDFLARPRLPSTFPWTTTTAQGASVFDTLLPSQAITDRIFAAKVAGFQYFRATIVVRMMINTQRFQAGRLLVTWMPFYAQNQTKFNDTKFLTYYTQRPRVEFDVSTDTEVTIKIPYVHPALAFDLGSGFNDAGRIDVICYSPLTSGTVTGNMYFSFEDVDLSFACEPGTFIAQSGGFTSSKKGRSARDPGDKEAADMGVNPVSSMLSSLATTASIGARIPLLSSVAGPVSWAASIAAKAAHAFGFSKPLQLAPRIRVLQQQDTHRVNCDGAHMAVNLGVFEDNKVCHLPGFAGTDLDEMSISSIIQTYAYFGSFNWNTSQTEGTLLTAYSPSPRNMYSAIRVQTVANNATAQVFDFLPMGYVANMFNLYRGSYKMKFKVVKTEFHSGRLRLNYTLTSDYTESGTPGYASANVHSAIFDLRESTEFEVSIPFGSSTPYIPTTSAYSYVQLFVETPLVAVGEVSTTVQILVEFAAGDDFEFAVPSSFALTPCTSAFTQIGVQSGVGSTSEPAQNMGAPIAPLGGATITNDADTSAEACVGEKILSFRQLLKRSTKCVKLVLQQTTPISGAASGVPGYSFSPYAVVLPNAIQPTNFRGNANTSVWWQPDYYSLVGCLFALARGSVRVSFKDDMGPTITFGNTLVPTKSYWNATGPSSGVCAATQITVDGHESLGSFGYTYQPFIGNSEPAASFDTAYNDVQMPYYSRTMSTIMPIGPWSIGNQASPAFNPGPTTTFTPTNNVLVTPDFTGPSTDSNYIYSWLYRSVGEDFSMGYFTGTYPMVAVDVTSATRNVA